MDSSFLNSIGWTDSFQNDFDTRVNDAASVTIGRVAGQGRGHYRILIAPDTVVTAAVTSKFHRPLTSPVDFPTVGDWVGVVPNPGKREWSILFSLKRKSLVQRRRAVRSADGKEEMQLIAANVDHMLIVTSMNQDFDLDRIGRYVSLVKDSGCAVSIALTKTDLATAPTDFINKTSARFEALEVFAVSNTDTASMEPLEKFFAPGRTTVLVGSSGVGKSTLTNYLLGNESQKTQSLSSEARGKHTTTTRDLRVTRFGGLVIDTPGMQGVADQTDEVGVSETFVDIERLELLCKFSNCQHGNTPGCAIRRAMEMKELSESRFAEYLKAKATASSRSRPR